MASTINRLRKLKRLEKQLAASLKDCETRELAALARQYRETIKEIEEIEKTEVNDDEIAGILSERDVAGKPGAVR